jgi:xanthine dehydrogenase iron-sulfur cluster and FAD-binding subunit A
MVLNTKAFLEQCPQPTEAEARKALAGNYCRCTGYKKPVEAVMAAAAAQCGVRNAEFGIRTRRNSALRNPHSAIKRGRR